MNEDNDFRPDRLVRHDVKLMWGVPTRSKLEKVLPEPWVIEHVVERDGVEFGKCIAPATWTGGKEELIDILLEPILKADEAFCDQTYGAGNPTLAKIKEGLRKRREDGRGTG